MLTLVVLIVFVSALFTAPAVGSPFAEVNQNDTLTLGVPFSQSYRVPSLLEPRQRKVCPAGWVGSCPDGLHCCPIGYICQEAVGKCCPASALQCGGIGCCDPATSVCCAGGCCAREPKPTKPSTTRTTSTSTSSRSSTSASRTTSCPISGRDLSGRQVANCPTPSAKPTTSKGTSVSAATAKPSNPPPPPQETRIPNGAMVFNYEKLRQGPKRSVSPEKQAARERAVDQLFVSMCKGLQSIGKTDSAIFTFTDDKKIKNANRKDAGCTGSPCDTSNTGKSCDEFPFASTLDGGLGAVFSCIDVLAQNIQGGVISAHKRKGILANNQHYELKIVGYDCKTNKPTANSVKVVSFDDGDIGIPAMNVSVFSKRNLLPGGTENDELESFPPFAEQDTNNTIIHSVGDISAGPYTIRTRVNQGAVSSLRVIDYLGEEYARADVELSNNGEQTLTFTLESDGVGMGFLMDTQLDTVNISSSMQVGIANAATPRATGIFVVMVAVISVVAILL